MLENTRCNLRLLAGAAGVTLSLAIAVGAGAVPMAGDDGEVRTAAVSEVEELAAPLVRQPGDTTSSTPAATPTTATPGTAVLAPSTTVAEPRTTTPPNTKTAAGPRTTQAAPAPVATTAASTAAAPAAPTKVARRTPSATEVQNAISELKRQVGGLLLLVSPTPAQIAQAGDQVCTAFDSGQTFAQVKATGLSMIPPSMVVSPATADWAVRQAVAMYCPGHASKLV